MADEHEQQPLFRVVGPDATAEEIAALVAVLSALGQGDVDAPRRPRSAWSHPERGVRRANGTAPRTGDDAWRASGLPR